MVARAPLVLAVLCTARVRAWPDDGGDAVFATDTGRRAFNVPLLHFPNRERSGSECVVVFR